MGRGNVSVSGPYEGLYYIDNGSYHVYRRDDPLDEEPETRLMGDLNYSELTSGKWYYDEVGTSEEWDDIEKSFINDFVRMFPSFARASPNEWLRNGRYGDCTRRAILESGLFYIAIEDNEWSMAVELVQKEGTYDDHLLGLQKRHWQRYMDGIKRCLLNRLPEIHFRCGPWMSGVIKRGEVNVDAENA